MKPLPKLQLYKEVISSTFKSKTRLQRNEVTQIGGQLYEANKRLSKARDLVLTGDIQADNYRIIKSESEEKIHRLEARLTLNITTTTDIESLLNEAISNILQLDVLYSNGSMCLIDKQSEREEDGTISEISNLSQEVTPLVQNLNYLLEDLKLLCDLIAA